MGNLRKISSVAAGLAALALLAGCSSVQGALDSVVAGFDEAGNAGSADECKLLSDYEYGSAESADFVTDEFGSYCSVRASGATLQNTLDIASDASLQANGITDEELRAAQEHALSFTVEEVMDSELLDPGAEEKWAEWLSNSDDLGEELKGLLLNESPTALVVASPLNFETSHQNFPRGREYNVYVDGVTAGVENGSTFLTVSLPYNFSVMADKDVFVEFIENAPGVENVEEELANAYYSSAEIEGVLFPVTGTLKLSYAKGDPTRIVGVHHTYDVQDSASAVG